MRGCEQLSWSRNLTIPTFVDGAYGNQTMGGAMPVGFTTDLNEAEKACHRDTGSLPNAVTMLREPIADIRAYEGWDGPSAGGFESLWHMQAMYEDFCETIGQRQIKACDIMDDTAQLLRDIIAVYRRVDGQY